MHELSIVEALIEQVEREVADAGQAGRISRLELVIGKLSGVSCDAVRFAFELLSADTPLTGAEVHIAEPPAVCVCRDCNEQTEIDQLIIECPECSSRNIAIEGGRELLLQSIEIEEVTK